MVSVCQERMKFDYLQAKRQYFRKNYRFLSKDDDRWGEAEVRFRALEQQQQQQRGTYAKYYNGKVKHIFSWKLVTTKI